MQAEQVQRGAVPVFVPDMETWAWLAGGVGFAVVMGILAHAAIFGALSRIAARVDSAALKAISKRLCAPSRVLLPLVAAQFVLGAPDFESPILAGVRRFAAILLIAAVTWTLIRALWVAGDVVEARAAAGGNGPRARRVRTQVQVLSQTGAVLVGVVGLAAALMTFPHVRQVGASLLASAGLAGLVAGIAARPVLENLIAGVQLAFTEPIRLEDVVVVEGEWGKVEEITPTFVVVRLWDDRRIVTPLSYFITRPFENWTKRTADIVGTVVLWVDYSVPVQRVRDELRRILEESPHWDKREWALQVTDTTAAAVQLRANMSATDGAAVWSLRVEVRERLVDFLRREFPGSPPKAPPAPAGTPA